MSLSDLYGQAGRGNDFVFFLRLNELVRGWCRCCGKRCCFLSSLMNRNSFNRVFFFNCFFLLKFYFTIAPARSRVLLRSFFFCDRQWISSFFFFSRRQGRKLLFFFGDGVDSVANSFLVWFCFVLFLFLFGWVPLLWFRLDSATIDRTVGNCFFLCIFILFYFFWVWLCLWFQISRPPFIGAKRQKNKCVPLVVAGWISRLLGFTEFLCFRFGWVGFGLARAWSYRVRFRVHWILPSFTGFYCVLLRFNRVLLSFWVFFLLLNLGHTCMWFLGFYRVWPSFFLRFSHLHLVFIGFCLIPLGFTEFFWVLLGFT